MRIFFQSCYASTFQGEQIGLIKVVGIQIFARHDMTTVLFESFQEWANYLKSTGEPIWKPAMDYEIREKSRSETDVWDRVAAAYAVMKDAVETGLSEDMTSRSGMIRNGAKKVRDCKIEVLGPQFKQLIVNALSAKELNACMGRIVAAPTAGASGIMPGVLSTLQALHKIPDRVIHEAMLVSAGIALIIEQRASISGAVGGCQAETGTAAAMGAGAVVYALGGTFEQICEAVAITLMNMLGLICDPVAGLVEVPCVKRNGSGAVIAFASAQIALAGDSAVIPVDEVVDAMGEVGMSMEEKYKETALGGIANTPTAREIEKNVLVQDFEEIDDEYADKP